MQAMDNDRELASGGNDNRLYVWNQHSIQLVLKYCEHTAAVKAIAWSPHLNGLLASGGGTADKCIRFWKTTTNSSLCCINTGNQENNYKVVAEQVNKVLGSAFISYGIYDKVLLIGMAYYRIIDLDVFRFVADPSWILDTS